MGISGTFGRGESILYAFVPVFFLLPCFRHSASLDGLVFLAAVPLPRHVHECRVYDASARGNYLLFLQLLGKPVKYRIVTSAEVHDSQELKNMVEKGKDKIIYADAGYVGEEVQKCIPEGVKNRIHEKGKRNKPLAKKQEKENKAKSHIRVRVEHVFGMMTNTMKGILIRSIGIARACFNIGLMNLVYNLSRYAYGE